MLKITTIVCVLMPFLIGAKHTGPAYDVRPRNALDSFAKDLAKKHHLVFLNSGVNSLADAEKAFWAISLVSNQRLTLEQGRALASEITDKLLFKIHHDPLFAKFCKMMANQHRGPEVKDEYAAFRLAFWDENMNRPLYPFIAQIRLADNHLYYHYADPHTQALQEPIVESLESLNLSQSAHL